jgi:transposase
MVESLRKSGRGVGKKLTGEQVIQIKILLREGAAVKNIAKDFEVSYGAIAHIKTGHTWGYVKVDGFVESAKRSRSPRQQLNEEQVIQIKTLLREGTAGKEIAKDFKVSCNTIASIKTGNSWGYVKVDGFVEGTNKSAKDCEPLIMKLYAEGVKIEKIKEICSLSSASSVYDVLKRNNIRPTRKPSLLNCPKNVVSFGHLIT